jgi:TPR repeat protein
LTVHSGKLAADEDNSSAQFDDGIALSQDSGVRQNLDSTAQYFKLAGDSEMAQAQWNYVNALLSDQEIRRDSRIAAQYLKVAEQQNVPPAQWGHCLRGISVIRDIYLPMATDKSLGGLEKRAHLSMKVHLDQNCHIC